jgi:hypothetical protein
LRSLIEVHLHLQSTYPRPPPSPNPLSQPPLLWQTFSTKHYLEVHDGWYQTRHFAVGSPEHVACHGLGDIAAGMAALFNATGTIAFHNGRTGTCEGDQAPSSGLRMCAPSDC